MKQENRKTGGIGESLAVDFLKKKGFEIIERNFATKFGEIDIVAEKNGVTIFVEVKTKKGEAFGSPEEMVGRTKLTKVRNMAIVYLGDKEVPCRIDMVAVVLDRNDVLQRITHYENLI